jgi:amidase
MAGLLNPMNAMIEHVFASRQVGHSPHRRRGVPRIGTGYVAPMSVPDDTRPLDGVAMADLVARGEVSPSELVEAAIGRVEAVNGDINAVVHPLYEQARAAAASMNDQEPRGSLWGVPFLTKDLVCATAGDPYHGGVRALRDADHRAPADTNLAVMFRELGLVNLGRTNTPELGLTITTEPAAHGPTRNPWNLAHSTGGSSGGSAAAVAAGVVPVAHANDGGGSIRIPAAECGLFGLKPSRGRVSQGPDDGDGWGGATIEGVVSRSVRDTAVVLDGISRPWPGDPYRAPAPSTPFASAPERDPDTLVVGLCTDSAWGPVHDECATAVDAAGALLEELGHQVMVSRPAPLFEDAFFDHFPVVVAVATAATLDRLPAMIGRQIQKGDVEGDTAALAAIGRGITGVRYVEAIEWFHSFTRRMAEWWNDHDVLVTPVLAEPPPLIGELRDPSRRNRFRELLQFTPQFNVTGQPAMSVPLHWSADNLPVGVQFVGPANSEHLLLGLGAQLERARPWAHRLAPVFAP